MSIEVPPRNSDTEYRVIFEQAAVGMACARFTDARWLDVNPAFCQMLGRSREEMLSTAWPDMTHPDDLNPDLELFSRMATGELDSYSVEKRLIHSEGHTVWARLTLSLVRDQNGAPDYEVAVIEEITDRRMAEEELSQSRSKLESERAWLQGVVDTIPTGLIMMNEHGELLLENAEWKRTWANDSPLNAPVDYDSYKGFRPDTGERIAGEEWPCAMSLKQGICTRDVILDIERFNGESGTIVVSSAPILDMAGRVVGAVAANMDITELRAAQAQLMVADRRKDEFLAMLSHELRGPLGVIVNTVQLLGRQPTEADAKRYVSVLQRQTRLLQSMVDDLLDVSRITRGLIELKLKRFDIRDAVESALENVQALMDQKDHDLSVTLPRKAVEVIGDSARLEQVLINLLTNAAKYTDAGGQIAFCLEREESNVKLSVRDNGIGMTADVRERIFDLFGQAEHGLARSQGGLGIGLTIVKNLVEQHGGHVDVRSEGLNQGAEFVVTLPLAPAEDPSVELVLVQQPQPIPTKGKRVLVVDDNVDIAETLALLLEDSGHTVTVAHDGPSALVRAEEDDPQVILLDIGLPGMDGYEVARQLRANPRIRNRVLAALTGYGQASDRQLALEAGFNQHFTKPVDIAALEDFVGAPQPELNS